MYPMYKSYIDANEILVDPVQYLFFIIIVQKLGGKYMYILIYKNYCQVVVKPFWPASHVSGP